MIISTFGVADKIPTDMVFSLGGFALLPFRIRVPSNPAKALWCTLHNETAEYNEL